MKEKNNKNKKQKKLKPVVYENGHYSYRRMDKYKQNLLLKAMQITSDPHKMRKLAGIKTINELNRTLDKMALRKEYHKALVEQGLDLETIVGGIKEIAEQGASDRVRLDGWKTLLKSMGLDEYKESISDTGKSWEELVKEVSQEENEQVEGGNNKQKQLEEYKVDKPEIPEEEQKRMSDEYKIGKSLYDE